MYKHDILNNVQKSFIKENGLKDITIIKSIIPVKEEVIVEYLDEIGISIECKRKPYKSKEVKPHDKVRWTDKEVSYLNVNAPNLSIKQIASDLGRTENSIIGKAYREGIELLTRRAGTE